MWTYDTLKRYADNESKIGDWKGKRVYVASYEDLGWLNSDHCFIIYDDGNKLIQCQHDILGYHWMVVGYVYSNGNVKECTPFKYENLNEKVSYKYEISNEKVNLKTEMKNETKKSNGKMNSKPEMKTSNEKVNSKTDYDEVIGDVRLGILVDETLSSARTTTIDSLLAGFDYGLDKAVG